MCSNVCIFCTECICIYICVCVYTHLCIYSDVCIYCTVCVCMTCVSRSRTMHPQSPSVTIAGTVLKECWPCYIGSDVWSQDNFWEASRWLLRSCRAASQWLGIFRKSWQVFHDRLLLGRCFRGFVFPVLEHCSAVWCSSADNILDYWTVCVVSGASFLTRDVYEHIVDLWQYDVCCTGFGLTRCTLFVVLFLCRCALHEALWSHIGARMRLLSAGPRSIAGLLFPCQYLCGTILVTPYSMVWGWRVSRARSMPFYWRSCSLTFCLLLFSVCLSFYVLVLWGWSLWTDWVLIALSKPFITNLF